MQLCLVQRSTVGTIEEVRDEDHGFECGGDVRGKTAAGVGQNVDLELRSEDRGVGEVEGMGGD